MLNSKTDVTVGCESSR